ncbi:MAG: T9SS type A sorting domain-containing protein [Bacteroidota bacterium]
MPEKSRILLMPQIGHRSKLLIQKVSVSGLVLSLLLIGGIQWMHQADHESTVHLSGKLVFDPQLSPLSKKGINILAYSDLNQNHRIEEDDFLLANANTDENGRFFLHVEQSKTFITHIRKEKDDAWQESHQDKSYVVSKFLPVHQAESSVRFSGLRFREVSIPPNAYISSAYIQFTAPADIEASQSYQMFAEHASVPAPFSSETANLSQRLTGKTHISWTVPEGLQGQKYESPDISALIESVIQQDEWYMGNPIVLLLKGNSWLLHERNRQGNGARLVIHYSVPNLPILVTVDPESFGDSVHAVPQAISLSNNTEVLIPVYQKPSPPKSPIQWTYFSCDHKGGQVELFWHIKALDQEVAFDILRSADGIEYERIGSVSSMLNTPASTEGFRFLDPSPPPSESSVLAYRVRASHAADQWTYSKVLTIKTEIPQSSLFLQLGESGPAPYVSVQYRSDFAGPSQLEVIDVSGQSMYSIEILPSSDMQTLTLPTQEWPKGMYYFHLQHGDDSVMQPYVVK